MQDLSQDPELLKEFVFETREHLGTMERSVLELERDSHSPETLNAVFRAFHTIKGLAGFLGFTAIEEVAHEVETMLDFARNGTLVLNPARIDVVLATGDYIGGWLRYIERSRSGLDTSPPPPNAVVIEKIRSSVILDDTEPFCADSNIRTAWNTHLAERDPPVVKVDTAKLEHLLDLVSELLIAESRLREQPDVSGSGETQHSMAQLGNVTAEIQKTALSMRMVQIGPLFRRMTRLVRDIAAQSGKLADIEFAGEDVEVDRRIVEELSDPLVHLLRNSMDHGLEPPTERERAGKPARGKIRLAASMRGSQVIVEVSDDGRGLDRERLLRSAIRRCVVDPWDDLTDSQVWRLIFAPGVTTAERVTGMSGRGVGMDIVRRHIDRLCGEIEIDSSKGRGTRFLLKIPLSFGL